MGLEIEKKFLPASDGWRGLAPGEQIKQGYISVSQECAVRVRIKGTRAWLGIKGKTEGATRMEFEYPIPVEDAHDMLHNLALRPIIEKTRYLVPFKGFVWEIDEFEGENKGLIVAEIELESEDQAFEKPDWIGEEVTADPRYYNANLVRCPFAEWNKDAASPRKETP